MRTRLTTLAAVLVALTVLAGCGGSGGTSTATSAAGSYGNAATTAATARGSTTVTTTAAGPGALQAEANSAAAGDIPDNQVFLVFRNRRGGYTMKYPEGWAQQGSGDTVTFRDKNNIVRVVAAARPTPTRAAVQADLRRLASATSNGSPTRMTISGRPAFKAVYTTVSSPNAVTGKRVTLTVDRYYVWKGGRVAVVDLGTPVGVDNVDAYRMMIESFRWK
jgi:hypothetical protein